ncbi:MAG: sugar transferase [Armatimonadetes bacterium]|nr:sugar transferase [Armatimonadota bacterium]
MRCMKYWLTALVWGAGMWMLTAFSLPLSAETTGLLVALLMATVFLEKDSPERIRAVWHRHGATNGKLPIRALIVGAGTVGQMLARSLEADGRYHVVGFVDDQLEGEDDGEWQVLGGKEQTFAVIQKYSIDEVFLAYAPTWQQRLAEDLTVYHPEVRVRVVPSAYEALMRLNNIENLGDIAVVQLSDEMPLIRELVKRAVDITAALGGLVLLSPVMLVVAVLVKLTSSRGPVIFAQERVGRYGVPFVLYKFRTMVHNAEASTGPVLSSGGNDSRLTSVGRWLRRTRLDELPQLWNVLRGEMSLVGPRPERPCFVREFERIIQAYSRRHLVRPGLTGLAQVCAGYHTDPRDKLRFDLIYLSHQSFWLDVVILLRTILVVCRPH